jgi:hypothetical protein
MDSNLILSTVCSHRSAIQYGDLATWLGAIATFLAVAIALYFSCKDSKRRTKILIEKQANEVSAWIERRGGVNEVKIINSSNQPVYEVALSYGVSYGAGNSYLTGNDDQTFVFMVPPGTFYTHEPRNPGGGMHTQSGISISFRDTAGKYWRRGADGVLVSVATSTFKELDISEPISDWSPIRRPDE